MVDIPESSPQVHEAVSGQNNGEDTQTGVGFLTWLKLLGGTVLIIALVIATVSIIFDQDLELYELVLLIALTSYFPLTYLSYRHFRGKVHQARVHDDFRLLGILDEEGKLEETYNRVYSSQQFTVYVAMAVLATLLGFGIFQIPGILNKSEIVNIPSTNLAIVFYAFLGTYAFSVFYVYRRYVTLDLQPTVYLYITVRIFTVQAVAFVIGLQLQAITNEPLVPIVAFIIGYVPNTGIRWMMILANRILKMSSHKEEQQLTAIEGISLWHETRLLESGIDNLQNLAAVDVPDLLMHSRFSAQQLMHWIDQAILQINVTNDQRDELKQHGLFTISALHSLMDKADELDTVHLPHLDKLTPEDLRAVYYAAATGPNLHYVTHYWRAVERYRTEMVNRSLADTLRDQFQSAELAGTDLADVPAERLGQVLDSFSLTPKKAEALFDDSPESLVGLARVYIQRQQPKEAIRVLNKVIGHKPKHAEAHSTLGWAKFAQRQYRAALEYFDDALTFFDEEIERNPLQENVLTQQKAVTLNRKGTTLLQQQLYDPALTLFDEAISLNEQYASAYFNRGHVKRMLGKFREAIADFNLALTNEPDRIEAYLERGDIFLRLGDTPEAISNFSEAIRRDRSNAQGYFYRGNAYLRAGDDLRALYDLDTALDIDPDEPDYYWLRGDVRRKLEDYKGAIAEYTQALRLNIDLARAYESRATLYARTGKLTEAVADYERYLELDKTGQEKIEKRIAKLKEAIQKRKQEASGSNLAAETQKATTQIKSQ